jgi:hypothetical protein
MKLKVEIEIDDANPAKVLPAFLAARIQAYRVLALKGLNEVEVGKDSNLPGVSYKVSKL